PFPYTTLFRSCCPAPTWMPATAASRAASGATANWRRCTPSCSTAWAWPSRRPSSRALLQWRHDRPGPRSATVAPALGLVAACLAKPGSGAGRGRPAGAPDRAIHPAVGLRRRARLGPPACLAAGTPPLRPDYRGLAVARRGLAAGQAAGRVADGTGGVDHGPHRAALVDGGDGYRDHGGGSGLAVGPAGTAG